jgi:hypothetical protein
MQVLIWQTQFNSYLYVRWDKRGNAHSLQSQESTPYVGLLDSVQGRSEIAYWCAGAAKRLAGKTDSLTIKPQAESALRLGLRREQDKVNKLKLYATKCVH